MKIQNKKLLMGMMSLTLASVALGGTVLAAEDTKQVNSSIDEPKKDSEPFIPIGVINKALAEKGQKAISASEVPTKAQVNKALQGVIASKDDPEKVIDLGNGHKITISVSGTSAPAEQNNVYSVSPQSIQSVTAKGEIKYTAGVDIFTMSITQKYSYDDKITKITQQDKKPSTSYGSGFGWKGSDSEAPYIYEIDDTAKDAVGNGQFKNIIYGKYGCHIELRFTATGNYYVHDSYFN
ncbi:hypothetical protein EEL30_02870 [Brevibacillus laterosporus]|uniref:Uncharacterized protein n=1 Tax=Brevibacillus laterosporus TaxID=1465 RepID=A0A518V329_BRELA|nr:hypothetical protein EEL30_02870 [Brevibacillus laterosporus]